MTLAEMEAAGKKASAIREALERLAYAERELKLVNQYAEKHAGSHWSPDLCLERSGGYGRDVTIKVKVPFGFIQRQAIDNVHDARRSVVAAGGDLPSASSQIQRGRA